MARLREEIITLLAVSHDVLHARDQADEAMLSTALMDLRVARVRARSVLTRVSGGGDGR